MAKKYQDIPPMTMVNVDSKIVKTGGWRTFCPILDEVKCISCYICWKFCPEPAIIIDDEMAKTKPRFDLDHCKGCGICAHECPKEAIEMVLEVKE